MRFLQIFNIILEEKATLRSRSMHNKIVKQTKLRSVRILKRKIPDDPYVMDGHGNVKFSGKRQAKFTTLKNAFLEVFQLLGGTEGLYNWVQRHPKHQGAFYFWVVKMLPREVAVSDSAVTPNDLSNLKETELDDLIAQHIKNR
jgi:hypothetical protein